MDVTLEERYVILEEIFGNTVYNRKNDEVLIFCPKHNHRMRKLSVNVRRNKFRCWVCGYAANKIFSLLWDFANKNQRERYLKTLGIDLKQVESPIDHVELPEEYQFCHEFNTPVGMMMEKFLYDDMQLEPEVVLQTKLGYCESGYYKGRAVFPSFDAQGKLNYFITRRIDGGDFKKYLDCFGEKYPIIFNELFVDWSKPIIIVEAVKAHLKHFKIPNVIPIMGTTLTEDYKLFEEIVIRGCPKVFMALDKEAKKRSMNIMRKLSSYSVDVRLTPLERQPDEISTNEFVDRLMESVTINKDDIIKERLMAL